MSLNNNPVTHQQCVLDMDTQYLVPLFDNDAIDQHHDIHSDFNPAQYSFLSSSSVQVLDSFNKENRQLDSNGQENSFTMVQPSRRSQEPFDTCNYYGKQPYYYSSPFSGIGVRNEYVQIPNTLNGYNTTAQRSSEHYNGNAAAASLSNRSHDVRCENNYYGQHPFYGRNYGQNQFGVCNEFMQIPNTLNGAEHYNGNTAAASSSNPSHDVRYENNYYGQHPYYARNYGPNQFGVCNKIMQIPNTLNGAEHYNGNTAAASSSNPSHDVRYENNYYGQHPYYARNYGPNQFGVCNEIMQSSNAFNGHNTTIQHGSNHFNGAAGSSHTISEYVSTDIGSSCLSNVIDTSQFSNVGLCNKSMQFTNPIDGYKHGSSHFNGAATSSHIASNRLPTFVKPIQASNSSLNVHMRPTQSNANETSIHSSSENRLIDENEEALIPGYEFNEIDTTLAPIEQMFANMDPKRRSCDNSEMVVQTSDRALKEKKYMCIYCKKFYPKIARHLEHVHKNEIDVQKLNGLPKGSKERRQILDILRNRGTFQCNNVRKFNNRRLIPARRPNIKFSRTGKDFKACPRCLGTYSKKGDHIRKCCKKAFNDQHLGSVMSVAVEKRIHYQASDRLETVCRPLRNTVGVRLLRYDWILIAFGNTMCKKYKLKKHDKNIRSKLRMCGRVFCELKSISKEITDFASIYNPRYYDDVIRVACIIGQFDEETDEFETPSSALDALLQVKDVGRVLVCHYIKQENHDLQKRTENFLKLLNNDASASIYKSIYDSLHKKKRVKVDHLPTIEDIKKMSAYLDVEIRKLSTTLKRQFSLDKWKSLSESILAWIVIFNRKRVGESERILITEFQARTYVDSDTLLTLTEEERSAAKRYAHIRVNGKKERTVAALLTPEIVDGINILLQHRQSAKISPKNEFLFAVPSIDTNQVFSACEVMRKYSTLCGAKEPTTLRGTMLRKHVATLCVSKKYTDAKVGFVADFMGHDEPIHRKCYRRNPVVDEIVNISKLLEEAKGDTTDNSDNDQQKKNDSAHNERERNAKSDRKRKNKEVGSKLPKKRRTK